MKYIIIFFLLAHILPENSFLSIQEKEQMAKIVNTIPDSIQTKFDTLFNQWVNNWKTNPQTQIHSSTKAACTLKEYAMLCNMGKDIIPLIVNKLVDYDNNFIGLQLYDQLQQASNQKVQAFSSEQDKARKTVLLWLKHQK